MQIQIIKLGQNSKTAVTNFRTIAPDSYTVKICPAIIFHIRVGKQSKNTLFQRKRADVTENEFGISFLVILSML